MRVCPVSNFAYSRNTVNHSSTPSFRNKHTFAKLLGGTMGTLGTLGAIGGTIIMTGGVALPVVAAYGLACAGTGAVLGHQIDKDTDKKKKDDK